MNQQHINLVLHVCEWSIKKNRYFAAFHRWIFRVLSKVNNDEFFSSSWHNHLISFVCIHNIYFHTLVFILYLTLILFLPLHFRVCVPLMSVHISRSLLIALIRIPCSLNRSKRLECVSVSRAYAVCTYVEVELTENPIRVKCSYMNK